MKRFPTITCAILLLLAPQANAEDPAKIYPRLVDATAWVRAGQQGLGTGWLVDLDRKWLMTNFHLVGDQERIEAFFRVRREGTLVTEREYYLENQKQLHEKGSAVWGKVVHRSEQNDLALIQLDSVPQGLRALPLAKKLPLPGDRVFSVGHRHDSESLWVMTTGEIRQKGCLTDGYPWRNRHLAENAPCWIVQSPINNGDSGSALVNGAGEVIGTMSGVRWQAPSASIAIELSAIEELLAKALQQPAPKEPASLPTDGQSIYAKLASATAWVRPDATEGRTAGWIVDRSRRLLLTTSRGAGSSNLVDVIFPFEVQGKLVPELISYQDSIALRKSGHLVRGLVMARDTSRDLALIELASLPESTRELTLADEEPIPGQSVQTVNHPHGVELLWLHAAGTVRQTATIEMIPNLEAKAQRTRCLLLQIPTQAASSGGAVLNASGRVVGLMSSRESPQQQLGYAITSSELKSLMGSSRSLWDPHTAQEHRSRLSWFLRHDQFPDSLRLRLKQLAAENPEKLVRDYGELLAGELAEYHLRHGELASSEELLRLIELGWHPPMAFPETYLPRQVELLILRGKLKSALPIADALVRENPKTAAAFTARSLCRSGVEAIADLDEAIWLDPKNGKAYFLRGKRHEAANTEDKAIADYGQAIEIDSYWAEPLRCRAALHLRTNQPKRAVNDLQRVVELEPRSGVDYHALAIALLAANEETKAVAAFKAELRWDEQRLGPILAEIRRHGEQIKMAWPDDRVLFGRWLRQALEMIGNTTSDKITRRQIEAILRRNDADDQLEVLKAWGKKVFLEAK